MDDAITLSISEQRFLDFDKFSPAFVCAKGGIIGKVKEIERKENKLTKEEF